MRPALTALLLGALLFAPTSHGSAAAPLAGAERVDVYPQPKSVHPGAGRISLRQRTTIVTGPATDASALAVARAALGPAAVRVVTDPARAGRGLVVRLDQSLAARRSLRLPAVHRGEGSYVLGVGTTRAGRETIVLHAGDGAGQFYAAQTLRQLVAGRSSLGAVVISDWASFPTRGIVEGFYGRPWTLEERLSALDFMGAHKLNAYMYAPKDDPWHRERWRDPYPAGWSATFGRLARRAAEDHVLFTFAVSPGLTACYSSRADLDALDRKLAWAWRAGIRSFAVAFDDVPIDRPLCASDQARFGTDSAAVGKAQATFLNAMQRRLRANFPGVAPLITVPVEYKGLEASPYKTALSATLDPAVVVQWTGRYGVSVAISRYDAVAARALFRQPLVVWDNYFVNDYCPGFLALGALERHDADLDRTLSGILADPMNQPESAKLGLFTLADYAWNPGAYEPSRSWEASLAELAANDAQTTPALTAFADANYGSLLNPAQAPRLARAIDAFWTEWDGGDRAAAAARLRPVLRGLAQAPGVLRRRLRNPAFLAETAPWLDATQAWGQAALAALDVLVERDRSDTIGPAKLATLSSLENTARAARVGDANVQVAPGVLDAFVQRAAGSPTG